MHDTPYGYCQCGCGERTTIAKASCRSRGLVRGEPKRFLHGHGTRAKAPDATAYEVRDEGYDTPCWIWLRSLTPAGYGEFGRADGKHYAHRHYYEQANGPIPSGLELDHLCRNRACCNPAHLEAVTHSENVRRGAHVKLTADDVREIRRALAAGHTKDELGPRFGVSPKTIESIIYGYTWADVV